MCHAPKVDTLLLVRALASPELLLQSLHVPVSSYLVEEQEDVRRPGTYRLVITKVIESCKELACAYG